MKRVLGLLWQISYLYNVFCYRNINLLCKKLYLYNLCQLGKNFLRNYSKNHNLSLRIEDNKILQRLEL